MKNQQQFDDRSPALKRYDLIQYLAKQAGMRQDRRVLKALRLIKLNPTDRKAIREVSGQIINLIKSTPEHLIQQQDLNPFQPYPGRIVSGPIRIGKAYNPRNRFPVIFGLHPYELNQNILLAGRAGAGKTVLLLIILSELMRLGMPAMVFDFKRDYRHLIRRYPSIQVFNWKNLKFNPFAPPPNTDFIYWVQVIVDIFFEVFFDTTPIAAKSIFLDFLVRKYQEFEKLYGKGVYPTLFDIDESISETLANKSVSKNYKERLCTAHSRIRPLLVILGEMFDCQEGYPIEDLLEKTVVLELDGLLEEPQNFLVNTLFHWIFTYRLQNNQRGKLVHALFFDEAKKIVAKSKASGSSTISRLLSMAREMGQAVIAADQMPSSLGDAILANVYTTIVLNLSAGKDIHAMGYAMGLNAEQRAYLSRFPVGRGVVKLAGRHTQPFLIEIPNFEIKKDVSDAELEALMESNFSELKFKPRVSRRTDADAYTTTQPKEESPQQFEKSPVQKSKDDEIGKTPALPFDLSEKEFSFLMDVKNRPFLSIGKRYESLGLSGYMGNRICHTLLEKELVRDIEIRIGGRGRSRKYLEFKEKAQGEIGRQNFGPGKGGFEHVFHQQRLRDDFIQKGFQAGIETYRNGKAVDLEITKEGISIAIELAMTPGGEVSNFQKNYQAGWTRIWSVCKDQKIMEQVQREWEGQRANYPADLVEFFLISDPRFYSDGKINN